MPQTATVDHTDPHAPLSSRLLSVTKGKEPAQLAKLAHIFGSATPAVEFHNRSDQQLQQLTEFLWQQLSANRLPDDVKLTVTNSDFTDNTVILLHMADQPFLLDSLRLELEAAGYQLQHAIHPVLASTRDTKGQLKNFDFSATKPKHDQQNEAFIYLETDPTPNADTRQQLQTKLQNVIDQARAAVRDFPQMQRAMQQQVSLLEEKHAPGPQRDENIAFLEWLIQANFIFLGYRAYTINHGKTDTTVKAEPNTGLGLLKDVSGTLSKATKFENLPANLQQYYRDSNFLTVTKALQKSPIHRRADLDYIGIREHDNKGRVIREHRFVGLFTSRAYTTNAQDIPIIGHKIHQVLDMASRASATPGGSHNYRALINILETYPRDELFQISVDDLYRIASGILHLQERLQVRFFMRHATHEQTISALVFLPRDVMNSELRLKIQDILVTSCHASDVEFQVQLGTDRLARIFYKLRRNNDQLAVPEESQLEKLIQQAARTWQDELADALFETNTPAHAEALLKRYGQAFRRGYQEHTPISTVVEDIAALEHLRNHNISFYVATSQQLGSNNLRLRVFQQDEPIPLAQIMPHLTTMGLQVTDERPTDVRDADGKLIWLHDFGIQLQADQQADLPHVMMLNEALTLIWRGDFTSDTLNQLILSAGLDLRQISVLRGLCGYIQQTTRRYGGEMIHATMVKHHHIARLLADLFDARFDPAHKLRASASQQNELSTQITEALKNVAVLEEDRLLQRAHDVILATLRTNAWQQNHFTDPLVFKIESGAIRDLVKPTPWREIYVYHRTFEGVHMRGGPVARGGLRWSDRLNDFRTEVLGLVKTQVVKNTVIVPTGSKGGFIIKQPIPADRTAAGALAEETYKKFITSLLCVTDNLAANGDVVAPRHIKRYDEDDPYLVVAADKGTATFSDTANKVATEADYWEGINTGFWMNDAFASGGSNGYDHKKMGITARGAWECVRHHFMMRGTDIQTTDFTVAGIGDMGGDVFGNGMLLSKHIRLVAAFNHRHIFLDPNPDAAPTYKERQRLFKKVAGWDQYNTKLISEGGGIFERSAKSIELTKEIQQLLGTRSNTLTPDEIIQLILKLNVDLLWNGGIGTYVKATYETDLDVGDRANDNLRINATELRAKVVGEGGNLGLTQKARIEYALHGGNINTDAIDNSGGVGASDREVNLKILFKLAADRKKLSRNARNILLEEMTDEVGELVLRDNQLQSWALTLKQQTGPAGNDTNYRLMATLSQRSLLDRRLEALPDEEELEQRRRDGQGFTRPELAVLMAYAKIALKEDLIASNLPDEPALQPYLTQYFPQPVQAQFAKLLPQHRLQREIIATAITNELINRMGLTFLNRMADETGHTAEAITRAFIVSKRLFEADRWWQLIEQLTGKVPPETQVQMMDNVKRLIEFGAFWLLRRSGAELDIQALQTRFEAPLAAISNALTTSCTTRMKRQLNALSTEWQQAGLNKELAEHFALLPTLTGALDVALLAEQHQTQAQTALQLYFMAGDRLQLAKLKNMALNLDMANNWQRVSALTILDDLYGHHRDLTGSILTLCPKCNGNERPQQAFDRWTELSGHSLKQYDRLLEELGDQASITHPMLVAVLGQLKGLSSV